MGTDTGIDLCCSQPPQSKEEQKLSGSRHVLIKVVDTGNFSLFSSPLGTRLMKFENTTKRTRLKLVLFGPEISWKVRLSNLGSTIYIQACSMNRELLIKIKLRLIDTLRTTSGVCSYVMKRDLSTLHYQPQKNRDEWKFRDGYRVDVEQCLFMVSDARLFCLKIFFGLLFTPGCAE